MRILHGMLIWIILFPPKHPHVQTLFHAGGIYYPIGGIKDPAKKAWQWWIWSREFANIHPPPPKKKGQKHLQISHFRLMEEVLARWVGQVIISMICFGSSFHPTQESQESTNVPYCIRSFLQLTGISNQKLTLKSGEDEFCWSSSWV